MLLLLFCMISLVQTALAVEWRIGFDRDITINENVDVTVTQGAATGTLKIALTGTNIKVSIETSSEEVTFTTDADLVIGSTTVKSEYIYQVTRYCLESESDGDTKVSVDCICWSVDSEEECFVSKGHRCDKSKGRCHKCGVGTYAGISFGGFGGSGDNDCYPCSKGVSQTYFCIVVPRFIYRNATVFINIFFFILFQEIQWRKGAIYLFILPTGQIHRSRKKT